MKIGIMSMQRIINYGSFLQAYGLKKTIENMGHTVEFVDYEKGKPIVENSVQNIKSSSKVKKALKVVFSSKYRKERAKSIESSNIFANFYNTFKTQWLPTLIDSDKYNYTPNLDVLVIGSDEVFNCTQSNPDVGFSPQLFGYQNNAKRLITYAASFGSTTIEKLQKYQKVDEIAGYLKKFDAISVRDNNSHKIVKELATVEPVDSIDPVLLYDFSRETDSIKIDLSDYVVVYAYADRISEDEGKAIQQFAHSRGKKTLSIGIKQRFVDEYINADPFTLLAYIKNSDYVITDTFHGTVFSIKYQIPFVTLIRESNKEKLSDLLNKFNLGNRWLNDINNLEQIMDGEFDKTQICKLIDDYRIKSHSYLNENINLCKNNSMNMGENVR